MRRHEDLVPQLQIEGRVVAVDVHPTVLAVPPHLQVVLLVHKPVGLVPDERHVVVLAHEVLSHQVLQIPGVDVDAHIPPADAITPVAPVGVDTQRPEDHTLKLNSSGSSGDGK